MKRITTIISSSVTGVAMAGLIAAPAFACTPKGLITKYVQDQTTGSAMVDANSVADALAVHPGDTLIYTIVVANNGGTTKDDADAMIETMLTDNLPAGVSPVSGTAAISENLGRVSEHSKLTKTYTVTVSKDAKDGDVITNKACFTGEATNHDKKQHQAGCDVAIIKVNVPPVTPPTPPTTPVPPVTPPKALPNTGAGNLLVPAGIVSGLGYVGNMLRLKRRASKRA
jgi:uncharacterized repeat protein (TIGR01451 family)